MTSCAPSGATPPRRTNRSNTLHARCFLINRSFLASKCAWILCVSLGKWVHGDEACKQRALSLSLLWRWQYVLRSCSHFIHSPIRVTSILCSVARSDSVQASTSGINAPNFLKMSKVFRMCSCSNKCVCQLSNMKDRANFQVNRSNVRFLLRLTQNLSKKVSFSSGAGPFCPHFRVLTPPKIPLFSPVMRGGREGLQQGFRMWVFLGDKTGESIGIAWDNMTDKSRKRQTNERPSSSLGIDGFRACFSAW